VEAAIRNAVIKFEREFMGRGPESVRTFVLKDMIVIHLQGVLTPAECQLAKTPEGSAMVRQLRQMLITQGREQLFQQIQAITGAQPVGLFTDIDTQRGERMIIVTLDRELDRVGVKRASSGAD
jgi:uncharacterized protein YbcI